MTGIDSKDAASALKEIDDIVQRVRQSRLYEMASLAAMWWGVLVFAGNVATWLWPTYGAYIWISVNVAGVIGLFALSAYNRSRTGVQTFDLRVFVTFMLFFAFGIFCVNVLGHFSPRQQGTFWPLYFMLFYTMAGLWFGYALVAIGLGIIALTLFGYYTIGAAFPLWMAFVNGGGLILGGLWMRRI
ncbi:hypothetical protein [Bradyrhizobium iriomotense]|uniref:Uncharacterized protein n=1 Tax=Bradyrhizobium iriomotense TaxID=441950 RepID=A0ABQ6B2Z2_9BRAD|nr:hypothetical protein [Bradyrhizobium iriomotense]GLR86961.1 hypothetical protein GCM10007857_36720 [Bradyrhizobium iriomotense]